MARRHPHAAARSRIAATVLSVAAFAAIGRAIDLAPNATVGAAASAQRASTSLPSGATSSATASAASHNGITTATAVTTTHAS